MLACACGWPSSGSTSAVSALDLSELGGSISMRRPVSKSKAARAGLERSADPVRRQDKFRDKHDLKIALASDESLKMLTAYGVWGEKSMYGRKFMGVRRTTFLIGRDGRIARIWENVKVPGHAEDVLDAAKAL